MIKLFINNQLADLGSNKNSVDIKLNRSFLDLNKIDSRGGDFSYSIKLPKSKTNCVIFENAHVINSIDKFVRDTEYIAKLEVGGMSSLDGLFKLVEITEDTFTGVLLSNNIAWARVLEGKNLNELTNSDGSPWGFDYIGASGSSVQNSFAWHVENDNYSNSDVCWPLIPRGYFYHSATTNNTYFYDDSLTTSDVPPAVYQLKIVKKIFENIGWNVDGNLFYEQEHQRLFLPFCNDSYYKFNYKLLYEARSSGSTVQADIMGTTYDSFSKLWSGSYAPHPKTGFYSFNPSTQIYDPLDRITTVSFTDIAGVTRSLQNYYVSATGPINININLKFTEGLGPFGTATSTQGTGWAYGTSPFRNPALTRGGFFLYIHQDEQTTNDIYEDITEYLYNTSPSAVVSHPLVVLYYDVYQSSIYGTATSFQPYDNSANISVTATTGVDYFLNAFINQVQITGGSINCEMRNINIGNTENLRLAWAGWGDNNVQGIGTLGSVITLDEVGWEFNATSGNTSLIVDIAENLPEVSCLEFLKSWISMNNLFISYNQDTNSNINSLGFSSTVRFDTFDAFFLSNEKAVDITNNVQTNFGEPFIKPMNLSRNIYFKYANDTSDYFINLDKEFASLQSTSNNIYTSGDQTVDCIYSATKSKTFFYAESGTTVTLPFIANDSSININDLSEVNWSFNCSPRILKRDEFLVDNSGNTIYINIDGYPTKILLSVFDDQRENRLSLNWATENGLYKNYYERFLSEIGDSHILVLNSNINAFQYSKLEPQYPVKVQNQHYFLNLIDGFSPNSDAQTKIELIKKFTN